MAGFVPTVVASDEIDPMQPGAVAAASPQAQMVTSLKLNEEQKERLLQKFLDRIDEVRSEMGSLGGGEVEADSWMWERQKNQMQYDNEWAWRKRLDGDHKKTIFDYSNFSLNLSKRYCRLMAAKSSDDLVGTEPFFSAMPTEQGNPVLAKQAEGYVQDEISASNLKRRIREAQKIALIRNEAVVKLAYVTNDTYFRGPGVVAVGPNIYETSDGAVRQFAAGEPIVTPKGDYIYRKDDFFEDPHVAKLMRLEKEPGVAFRHQLEFAYQEDLFQMLRGYTGLDGRALDYRDFHCPLNAATVHEADINFHTFDEQWERLKAQYKDFEVSAAWVNTPYMAGEKSPKTEKQEQETTSKILKIVNCADAYMRCNPFEGDADDPGVEFEIWAVIDLRNKKFIWYDYLGNHMDKRPFEVIPGVELVPNRWYGVGVFEMLAHKQLYVDTQFNRVNFKSMKSSSVRFRVKNAVSQWKAGQELVFGDDKTLDIEDPRFNAQNPPLFQVNLTEIDEHAMKLIELMIQAGSTEVGIVGPDDGALAGLDTTKLATGIKSLERTGNLLMKFTETDHADAIGAIIDQAVDIILEHMDDDEMVWRPDSQELYALNRDEVRRMKKDVKLLLTRSRSTETIETARMVIQLCREYYEALTTYERYKLRGEYLRQLKALETPDAAQLLDEVTKEQADQWLAEQASKPEPLPPKTSIATKFGDLARPEQEQVLLREGIRPATEAQLSDDQKDKAKAEGEIAGEKKKAEVKADPNGSKPKASGASPAG
jgi:hypothetical protein